MRTNSANDHTFLVSSGGVQNYVPYGFSYFGLDWLSFADLDGDNRIDPIVPIAMPDGTTSIYYWPGAAGNAQLWGVIDAPEPGIRFGDFNGDGQADVFAYRCGMSEKLRAGPRQYNLYMNLQDLSHQFLGDLNGDGRADYIAADRRSDGSLTVWSSLSNGSSFDANSSQDFAQDVDGGSWKDYTILSGDVNGDGRADLILFKFLNPYLYVFTALGQNDGFQLGPLQQIPGEAFVDHYPLLGDFNGDGRTDLVMSSLFTPQYTRQPGYISASNNLMLLNGQADGSFSGNGQPENIIDLGGASWQNTDAYSGDFDGDGTDDILFNYTGTGNTLALALSDGLGGFGLLPTVPVNAPVGDWSAYYAMIGDVNGDGKSDIVWTNNCRDGCRDQIFTLASALSTGNGTFQTQALQPVLIDPYPGESWMYFHSLLADLNGDGKADLAMARTPGAGGGIANAFFGLGRGNGSFVFQPRGGAAFGKDGVLNVLAGRVRGGGADGLLLTTGREMRTLSLASASNWLFLPAIKR